MFIFITAYVFISSAARRMPWVSIAEFFAQKIYRTTLLCRVWRKCLGDADTEWQLLLTFHLHPLTGTVVGVPFPQFLSVWLCLSSTVHSRVVWLSWFIPVYYQLVLLLTAPSSVALHGVLRGGFRNDVLSVGVAKPGELSSVQR